MKKTILFCLIYFFLLDLHAQTLRIIYGDRLYYQKNDSILEIKALERAYFQGYDIIDSNHVFLAYFGPSAEAFTIISVYDLEEKKETKLREFGATGESYFIYNKENDYVLFDWYDGIYIFKIHDKNGNIVDRISEIKILDHSYESVLPFWVDKDTIVYYIYDDATDRYVKKYLQVDLLKYER